MTTWDDASRTHADAKRAVWDEDDYAGGIDHCLAMLAPLTDRLADGDRVLDVGCGIGRLTIPLARRFPRCHFTGLDPSPGMLAWAACTTDLPNVGWARGDVRRVEAFPPLDAIYSVVTFQHLSVGEQVAYFGAMADALGPDGIARFQVVTEGDRGPLSHPIDPGVVRVYFESADCRVDEEPDPLFPTWRWFTVRR